MHAPVIRQAVFQGLKDVMPSGTKVFLGDPGEDAGKRSAWIESVSTEHEPRGLAPHVQQTEFVKVRVRLEAYAERKQQSAAHAAALEAVDAMAGALIGWVESSRDLHDVCVSAVVGESESGADAAAQGWRGWWAVEFVARCDGQVGV